MPVGLSVPARMMHGPRVRSAEKQIRVNLRYVLVDAESRAKMYQYLGRERLKTVGSRVPNLHPDYSEAESADTRGTELISKSSHVTTCLLANDDMRHILKAVQENPYSGITRAPSIVLIDGQDTEVTDLVQRPFVVDLQRQETGGNASVNSVVQVLNEGVTVNVSASLTPSQRVHVRSKIVFEKIVDVETEEVFGISDEATAVQVPVHQRKSVEAIENLELGQTLLIDPYVKQDSVHAQTRNVPVLSNIPFLGDSFKSDETVNVTQHMIVLIQPDLEATAAPTQPR